MKVRLIPISALARIDVVALFFKFSFPSFLAAFSITYSPIAMQSFLQFRRFRDAAQAQIERDKERLQQPTLHNASDVARAPSSDTSDESKVDLEKGEHPVAADRTGGLTQSGEPVEEEDGEELEEDDDDDFELSQHRSNLSRTTTQQSAGTALGTVLSGVEVRKRTTRDGGDGRVFVVGYESEDDPNVSLPNTTRT